MDKTKKVGSVLNLRTELEFIKFIENNAKFDNIVEEIVFQMKSADFGNLKNEELLKLRNTAIKLVISIIEKQKKPVKITFNGSMLLKNNKELVSNFIVDLPAKNLIELTINQIGNIDLKTFNDLLVTKKCSSLRLVTWIQKHDEVKKYLNLLKEKTLKKLQIVLILMDYELENLTYTFGPSDNISKFESETMQQLEQAASSNSSIMQLVVWDKNGVEFSASKKLTNILKKNQEKKPNYSVDGTKEEINEEYENMSWNDI
jgi:hypothetical protein